MTTQGRIAAQLQELLEEVAKDPRSQVLRIPKHRIPVKAEPVIRDREALLTRAERQLVKVHRFEVADLLLQEVRRAVMEREEAEGRLLKYVSNDEISKAPDPIEWESRARYRLGTAPDDFEDRDALSLLQDCVRTTPGDRPSTIQLAIASLRLVPRATTRICLGLALYQEKQTFSGLEVLWDVLAEQPNDVMRSYAWQNIAELEWSLGHSQRDLEALRKAALAPCRRGDPAMNWFAEALRREDRSETLRAAQNLEEAVPNGHASTHSFIRRRTKKYALAGSHTRFEHEGFFLSLEGQLPKQAQRIGHALSTANSEEE